MLRVSLAFLVVASLAGAQSPLFQMLDNPIPAPTAAEAAGDLDGDGDVDLLAPDGALLNDGHGRFTKLVIASAAFPRQFARLVDMNGDGRADIVSSIAATASLAAHLRVDLSAGMAFVPGPPLTISYLPGGAPVRFATGDVDGDGDADILAGIWSASSHSGSLALWLNGGAGAFTEAPWTSVPPSPQPTDIVTLVDLDGDGDLDAVFASTTGLWPAAVMTATNVGGIFTADPGALWPNTVTSVAVGRFNSDALPNVILSDGSVIAVILSSPTGFQAPVITPLPPFSGWGLLATIDVNGDGFDEVLLHTWPRHLAFHPVAPSGVFGPPLQSWTDLFLNVYDGSEAIVRDLDGDGDRDVVAFTISEAVELMNRGASGFDRIGGRLLDVTMTSYQQVGDLDADGDVDIVGWNFNVQGATALNDGEGFFAPGPSSVIATSPYYILRTFDRDGDGDVDLYAMLALLGSSGPLGPDIVYDNVGGTFVQVTTVPGVGDGRNFRAADLDADGDQDIVIGRWVISAATPVGPLSFIRNLGPAGFAPPAPLGTPHFTYDVDLADFDGNGTIDVFQTNGPPPGSSAVESCVLYLNSGGGSFTPMVQTGMSGFFTAAGDLNGDGRADVVVDNRVWFSIDGGSFAAGPVLSSALRSAASLVDVDLDGDLDLVETPATVMLNLGSGAFGPPRSYLPRQTASPLDQEIPESALVDLDYDGDIDLVAPGPIVLTNTTRQVAHGSIARPGHPASIDLYGSPGGSWLLFGAGATASFQFPPWGRVLIDPASALLGATGTFAPAGSPSAGTASFGVVVPNNPALLGWTTYWQAIDVMQAHFTNRTTITVRNF